MTREQFDAIFQTELYPFIQEIKQNNPLIEINNMGIIKAQLYQEYSKLRQQYRSQIFNNDKEDLLDRHRVASCVCGAFLRVPIFDKTKLIKKLKDERMKIESVFYYVNELVAFFAGIRYLTMFMVNDKADSLQDVKDILAEFPIMPQVTKSKTGFWNIVLFNLSQIKDETQIGLNKYDLYSYAMFYYWLEQYYYAMKH